MRARLGALLASCLICLPFGALAAPAAEPLSIAYQQNTDPAFRSGMQVRLAWTGDYAGAFDGAMAADSLAAIREFQARHGLEPNGVMDTPFLDALVAESDAAARNVGFGWQDDARTGVRLGLPLGIVQEIGETEVGTMWRSPDGALEIESVRFTREGYTLGDVFNILRQPEGSRSVTSAEMRDDGFIIEGRENDRRFVIRFEGRDGDLRGFSISYPETMHHQLLPYRTVALGGFDAFASEPVQAGFDAEALAALSREPRYALAFEHSGAMPAYAPEAEPVATQPDGPAGALPDALTSSGSGFFVSADGWLLTNAHVTRSCHSVTVGSFGAAQKIITDPANDLALVKVDAGSTTPLPIWTGKPRLGEDVLTLGYPLRSILADSLNVTRGNISSLLGLRNDPNFLQISAPVQPGNSGGPVIDLAGRVVGVVTAKLNAVAIADITGDIPQSINFAIRPDVVARFLNANDVAYVAADPSRPLATVPDATEATAESVVPVLCLGAGE